MELGFKKIPKPGHIFCTDTKVTYFEVKTLNYAANCDANTTMVA